MIMPSTLSIDPRNFARNTVVYTGTHDTNTIRGWFVKEATVEEKKRLFKCIGKKASAENVSGEFIRLALDSIAVLSVIPIQDVLALGSKARMNHPARRCNNWEWRITRKQLANPKSDDLREISEASGRNA
jgi:4-alpha-glucanotransferase